VRYSDVGVGVNSALQACEEYSDVLGEVVAVVIEEMIGLSSVPRPELAEVIVEQTNLTQQGGAMLEQSPLRP